MFFHSQELRRGSDVLVIEDTELDPSNLFQHTWTRPLVLSVKRKMRQTASRSSFVVSQSPRPNQACTAATVDLDSTALPLSLLQVFSDLTSPPTGEASNQTINGE